VDNAGASEDIEPSHDTEVVNEDDVQPAEEVEPSPLDQLPETTPDISPSDLAKDKKIVAEVAPAFDIPMVLNDQVMAYVNSQPQPAAPAAAPAPAKRAEPTPTSQKK